MLASSRHGGHIIQHKHYFGVVFLALDEFKLSFLFFPSNFVLFPKNSWEKHLSHFSAVHYVYQPVTNFLCLVFGAVHWVYQSISADKNCLMLQEITLTSTIRVNPTWKVADHNTETTSWHILKSPVELMGASIFFRFVTKSYHYHDTCGILSHC